MNDDYFVQALADLLMAEQAYEEDIRAQQECGPWRREPFPDPYWHLDCIRRDRSRMIDYLSASRGEERAFRIVKEAVLRSS